MSVLYKTSSSLPLTRTPTKHAYTCSKGSARIWTRSTMLAWPDCTLCESVLLHILTHQYTRAHYLCTTHEHLSPETPPAFELAPTLPAWPASACVFLHMHTHQYTHAHIHERSKIYLCTTHEHLSPETPPAFELAPTLPAWPVCTLCECIPFKAVIMNSCAS